MPDPADMSPLVAMPLTGMVLLLLAGSLFTWQHIARSVLRGEPILASAPRRAVPWTGLDMLALLLISLAVGQLLLFVFAATAQTPPTALDAGEAPSIQSDDEQPTPEPPSPDKVREFTPAKLFRWGAVTGTAMGVCVGYLIWRRRPTWADFGLRGRFALYDIRLGVTAFVAAVVPVYSLQILLAKLFPSKHPLSEALFSDPSWPMIASGALLAIVVAPVTEEFFFRVLFQGWLESAEQRLAQRWSPLARLPVGLLPILVSSFVFGLAHGGYGPDPIPIFAFALALGYIYHRTHRYLPCVILHASLNGISVVLMIVLILTGKQPPV